MKNKKVLFIIHRLYFNKVPKLGGIDRIIDFLKKENDILTIEHPFEIINHPSEYNGNKKKYQYHAKTRPPLIWIEELVINLFWVVKSGINYDLAIASDPLNFFSCYILKIIGKVHRTQFHSTDYSNPRFSNTILEKLYQWLYSFGIRKADLVTVASQRMFNVAKNKVNNRSHSKIHILPNSPVYNDIPKIPASKKDSNDLVILVGRWGNQIDTEIIIKCLIELKKDYQDIKLNVIGNVDEKYRKLFYGNELNHNVKFHEALSYEQAMSQMAKFYIGITAYKETDSYVYYADSLKIREYAAAGLPVVCDKIYGTAEEVEKYKAGLTYDNVELMTKSIKKLIENKKLYEDIRTGSLNWAEKMDKKILLKNLYNIWI